MVNPTNENFQQSNRAECSTREEVPAGLRGPSLCAQTMSLMSRTWLVRCLSTNILDAPATVFLHVCERTAKQSRIRQCPVQRGRKERGEI